MNIKKIITITAVTGLALTATLPSYAFGLDIKVSLDKVLSPLTQSFKDISTKIEGEINSKWGNLKTDALAAIEDSKGEMNAPDPTTASAKLIAKLKEKGGVVVETSTVIGAVEAGKQLEIDTTRASAASILGKEGQQRTKLEIGATKETVTEAQQIAVDAQNMDASQDVLKAIAAQNAQIVSMLGQVRTDGLQQRYDAQHSNLMLSQIAEHGAEQNRTQRVLSSGVTSQFLELAGWSRLDPAYTK